MGQTYISPIKKETHSFGLITPQCNGCVYHLHLLWNSPRALAARPWRCQQGGVCQPVKGLSAVDPHGLCEHWTQIKGMEQRRREEVNCYGEGGRCANSDLHPWRLREVWDRERETDRERYRTSVSLIICLLMINPTMQCKRCHGLFEWEVVRLGCTSVLKAVYIFQVSKLLYKLNVGCLKDY